MQLETSLVLELLLGRLVGVHTEQGMLEEGYEDGYPAKPPILPYYRGYRQLKILKDDNYNSER